jgi:hypothetical protein
MDPEYFSQPGIDFLFHPPGQDEEIIRDSRRCAVKPGKFFRDVVLYYCYRRVYRTKQAPMHMDNALRKAR